MKESRRLSKYFLQMLMAILLSGLFLSACASQPPAPATTEEEPQVEEVAQEETELAEEAVASEDINSEAESTEEIVITHWYHQYGEEGTFEAAVRYAEEYSAQTPGVTVEVTWVPGDYFAALNAALLTDEGPDVFELQTADIARVNAGQLEPLNDLFAGDILDDFNATALSRVTVDDTIYGVPMIIDPQLIYYRKSALEEAGIEPPQTMDELIAAAAALDSGRVKGLYLGNDLGSTSYLLYMNTFAAGSDMLDAETVAFNTDKNVEMWQKKQELAQSGNLLVGAPTEWWDPSALIDGLTQMQYIGLWATPAMVEALGDDLGVMPWPAVDDSAQPSVFIGGWNQSVNANSQHVDAAKAYVNWLWIENTEVQQDWNLSYGFHIPPRKSAAASAEALQSGPAAEVLELVDMYGSTPSVLWTGAMDSAYMDAHSEVLLNGADPAEMLIQAETAVQAELDSLLGGGEEATASEAPSSDAEPAEEIVIQHWYHQYGEDGTFEAAVRYAEEYSAQTPGVTVEVNWVPGDYFAALNAALLTDEGPDVFELQTADIARVNAGQLEPLDDLFENGILDDFNATALSRVTVDGTIYGVPMIIDPQLIYYRKSALEEAGIEPPQTMDELIAAAAALDSGRVKGLYLGNDLGSTSYLLYMNTFAAGSDMLDAQTVAFNTDKNVEMWQKKQALAQSGNLLVGAPTEWWDPSALIDGLTHMQYIGLWATPAMVEALGDDLGVMPWPAVDDSAQPSVFIGGWNQSVNANSPHVDAAKAYVNWLWIENTEVQQDWNLSYGFHIPPRKSTAASAEALQSGPAAEVLELVDMYGSTPSVLWTGAMDSAYMDAHSEVLLNGADPAEMLSQAEVAIQSELDSLVSQ